MSSTPINRIKERRLFIQKFLNNMILCDISNLIVKYDFEINGDSYILGKHKGSIFSVCILNDGRLVTGSYDGDIKVWNLDKNLCESTIVFESNIKSDQNTIYCIA